MAKLPTGRYTIIETSVSSGIELGSHMDSGTLRDDISDGIYPNGSILMHVVSGALFKISVSPVRISFKSMTTRQKNKAERYRKMWWPNPQQRPRPRLRK